MSSDLILGILYRLSFASIRPFLQSLRQAGSTARVHFFVCGVPDADRRQIESFGATTQAFSYWTIRRNPPQLLLWPLWREWFARLPSLEARSALALRVMHLFGIRWVLYRRFLLAHRGQFQRIFATDVRDVFFQSDPFSMPFAPGIHCYLEATGFLIGQCPLNSLLIRLNFGDDILREMAHFPISCAGTTFGDEPGMLSYMETMIDLLCRARKFNSDQGIHNYLIHRSLIPNLTLHDNGAHAVRTVGVEAAADLPFNSAGQLLGVDGGIVPVIHQYERHSLLEERLLGALK